MVTLQKTVQHQNSQKEAEQIHQMFNMDKEWTSLKTLVMDTYDNLKEWVL